jgi:fatty acid desaturase
MVLNETINETIKGINGLTFNEVTAITTNGIMIADWIFIWLLLFFIYNVFGALTSTKGKGEDRKLISTLNFWQIAIIFFLILPGVIVFMVIIPIWLIPFS